MNKMSHILNLYKLDSKVFFCTYYLIIAEVLHRLFHVLKQFSASSCEVYCETIVMIIDLDKYLFVFFKYKKRCEELLEM